MEPEATPDLQPSPDRDVLLTAWVKITNNQPDMTTAITLQVGGLIVTGMLIGIAEYHKALGELFARSTNDATAQKTWRDMFRAMGESYTPSLTSNDDLLPSYIHLGNARVLRADGQLIPHNGGVLWRGRLATVDGWWFGSLESRPS